MTRLLAQLGTILRFMAGICWMLGAVACVDREGPEPAAKTVLYFVDPVPDGEPIYQEIVEPFLGTRTNVANIDHDAVSLFSFDKEIDPVADPSINPTTEIISSDLPGQRRGIVLPLNTVHDERGNSEYTIVVQNDSIFLVDHDAGSSRGLVHFAESVCEVRPKKTVMPAISGGVETFQVLHDDEIYVKTSEGNGTANDCTSPAKRKRYYRLALNFRFDAFESDPDFSNALISVTEAEYTGELVFGWNDESVTLTNPDPRLDYGFLGYDSQMGELVFFDQNRQRVWSQARNLERFNAIVVNGSFLPETWFKVEMLPQYQALVQLGRDVFIVDAGAEFFNREPSEIPTILSDRAYQKSAEPDNRYSRELDIVNNDADVLILDFDKLYRYAYAPSSQPPNANAFRVRDLPALGFGNEKYEQKHLFTQFDLRPCRLFSDPATCALVNFHQRENAADWQFITSCNAELGCSLPDDATDYCTTQSEFILTQDGSNLCRVLHYTHLNELNVRANDAGLVGFMPYVSVYARRLEMLMDSESVFITARMNERDILLRYFYEIPLSAPKSSRERVIFGQRIEHAGLDVYLNDGNLFVTSLNIPPNEERVRFNECYENYQRIECGDCSAADLLNGICVNQFKEYRSMALFCSADRLEAGTCTDNQILPVNQLIENIHASSRDGKWIEVLDVTAGNGEVSRTMGLVLADNVSDEGVLSSPRILSVDNELGVADQNDVLARITGPVETVHGRWNLDSRTSRLNLVQQDIVSSAHLYAKASTLFLDTTDQSFPAAVEAGTAHFKRRLDVLE